MAAGAVNACGMLDGAALQPTVTAIQAAATATLVAGTGADTEDIAIMPAGDDPRENLRRFIETAAGTSDGVSAQLETALEQLLDPFDQWSMPSVRPELLQRTAERLDMAAAEFRSAPQLPIVTPVEADGWSGEDVVVTGSSDGAVRGWRIWKGRVAPHPRLVLTGHEDTITCVHASAHFDVIASCSADGSVLLHSLSSGRLVRSVVPAWVQ